MPTDRKSRLEEFVAWSAAHIIDRGEPVTAPGIPPDFPNPKSLITDHCIRPLTI